MAGAATTTLGRLMARNVSEVFGERDPGRRERAIAELYADDCAVYDASTRAPRGSRSERSAPQR
jgi:hypothetical protein